MGSSNADAIVLSSDDSADIALRFLDSEDDDEQLVEQLQLRGPKHKGCTDYDKQCIFGNDMHLREDHVSFLFDLCDPASPPTIKSYLHRMTYTCVKRKYQLRFSTEFTDEYLKNLIGNQRYVNVHVSSMVSNRPMIVRMKMEWSNTAIFTIGWDKVVKTFKLKENDIVFLRFNERDDGELHVLVEALPGC